MLFYLRWVECKKIEKHMERLLRDRYSLSGMNVYKLIVHPFRNAEILLSDFFATSRKSLALRNSSVCPISISIYQFRAWSYSPGMAPSAISAIIFTWEIKGHPVWTSFLLFRLAVRTGIPCAHPRKSVIMIMLFRMTHLLLEQRWLLKYVRIHNVDFACGLIHKLINVYWNGHPA